MSAFPRLFEPVRIGPATARNRIVRLATVTNLAAGGEIGDRIVGRPASSGLIVTCERR